MYSAHLRGGPVDGLHRVAGLADGGGHLNLTQKLRLL
jgi:hypothetical protein